MAEFAIAKGFDSLGFSIHASTEYGIEAEGRDFPGYKAEILKLREEYAGRLEIFFGAELDYYSAGIMPELGFDYKIASVHHRRINGHFINYDLSAEDTAKTIERDFCGDGLLYARSYYDLLADMPNRIKGDFVGHFDLVSKFSEKHPELFDVDSRPYKAYALEALHAVREKTELFEVNTGAMGRGYRTTPYPAPFILDEMRALGCKMLISSDCHSGNFLDIGMAECREYLKAHGFDTVYNLTRDGFVGEKL